MESLDLFDDSVDRGVTTIEVFLPFLELGLSLLLIRFYELQDSTEVLCKVIAIYGLVPSNYFWLRSQSWTQQIPHLRRSVLDDPNDQVGCLPKEFDRN